MSDDATFTLPQNVVSKSDLARLVVELERVDNELTTLSVRESVGADASNAPVFSEQLQAFIDDNNLSLDDGTFRTDVIHRLRAFKEKAPVVHLTFATEADNDSLQKLVAWVRQTVDPRAVVEVGLQPSLVAGVYVRTPNHVYDFSLRRAFMGKRAELIAQLGASQEGAS